MHGNDRLSLLCLNLHVDRDSLFNHLLKQTGAKETNVRYSYSSEDSGEEETKSADSKNKVWPSKGLRNDLLKLEHFLTVSPVYFFEEKPMCQPVN